MLRNCSSKTGYTLRKATPCQSPMSNFSEAAVSILCTFKNWLLYSNMNIYQALIYLLFSRCSNSIKHVTKLHKLLNIIIPRKAGYCNHLRVSVWLFVCLFVCLFVSRISQKRLVGFWWNLVSREVMIIGRPSSKLSVIRIEIRIWDPDNCFSWTTGRILGSRFQSDPG